MLEVAKSFVNLRHFSNATSNLSLSLAHVATPLHDYVIHGLCAECVLRWRHRSSVHGRSKTSENTWV
jgi:hypothetical protein